MRLAASVRDGRARAGLRAFALAVFALAVFAPAAAAQGASASDGAIEITDSRGVHRFDAPPERVVALSWSMVENLIELDVTPIAMADPDGYAAWVARPAIPEGLVNVGTRAEPNVELIAELEPDVIIMSNAQAGLVELLDQVAPVLYFQGFSASHDNVATADEIFLDLARLFDREDLARQRLDQREQAIERLSERLREHLGAPLPPATALRFQDASVALVYGDNSLPQHALQLLGFEPAMRLPPTQWGLVQMRMTELGAIRDGIVLNIEPFAEGERLYASPIWQAMPFVQAGRFGRVAPTWTYGGAMSVLYLAEAMAEAVLALEPDGEDRGGDI